MPECNSARPHRVRFDYPCLRLLSKMLHSFCFFFCLRRSFGLRQQNRRSRAPLRPSSKPSKREAAKFPPRNRKPPRSQSPKRRYPLRRFFQPQSSTKKILPKASRPSACLASFLIFRPLAPTHSFLRLLPGENSGLQHRIAWIIRRSFGRECKLAKAWLSGRIRSWATESLGTVAIIGGRSRIKRLDLISRKQLFQR